MVESQFLKETTDLDADVLGLKDYCRGWEAVRKDYIRQ